MKAVFLFAFFSGCLCLLTSGSLLNFNDMIKKVTGLNAIPNYTTYGCHCGVGGSGRPVDATDRCCASHDCCYLRLVNRGCKPKSQSYKFTASGASVTCAGGSNECGRLACECDKTASLCFRANKGSYRDSYKFKLNFTCKGSKPAC